MTVSPLAPPIGRRIACRLASRRIAGRLAGRRIACSRGSADRVPVATRHTARMLLGAVVLVACSSLSSTALAQGDSGLGRVGFRLGGTIDPDQFHVGLHVNAGLVASRIRFQPSLEVGFGSQRTVLQANFDGLYLFERGRTVQPFLGAGLGVGALWTDIPGVDTEGLIGLNLVGGLEWGTRPAADVPGSKGSQARYLLELRFGIGDLPVFKTTIGINF